MKCSVIEGAHRTIRDKMYKYFTYKNTSRYIDVLEDFVTGYNDTVHNTIGMAPAQVSDTDVLVIWQRMHKKTSRVRAVRAKYSVVQLVRISKEKAKSAKSAEQNYTTEIFRIIKVIHRSPRQVYEMEYLNKKIIYGQFSLKELTPVRLIKRSTFKIDKILGQMDRRGILYYLLRWKVYSSDFDSWVPTPTFEIFRKKNMADDPNHFYVTLFSTTSQKLFHGNCRGTGTDDRPGSER